MIQYLRSLTAYQRTRFATTTIMVLAAAVSYGHQRALLASWGADDMAQIIVPLTVDLLAITCNIALHIPGVARRGFWTSLIVLVAAVAVSGTANYLAGGTTGAKFANLWTVVAYLLSEFVTASVKASARVKDPVRVAAGRKAAVTKKSTPARKSTTRKPRAPKSTATVADVITMMESAEPAPVSPVPLDA